MHKLTHVNHLLYWLEKLGQTVNVYTANNRDGETGEQDSCHADPPSKVTASSSEMSDCGYSSATSRSASICFRIKVCGFNMRKKFSFA